MANILAIIPGMSFEALCAMSLADLMRWFDRAAARVKAEGR